MVWALFLGLHLRKGAPAPSQVQARSPRQGVTSTTGREAIAAAYDAHLDGIFNTAGAAAVSAWLAAHA